MQLNFPSSPKREVKHYPHLTDKETEAQKGKMNLSEVTQEIGNDPQSLGTRPATACQAPRWPRRHSVFLQEAAWALPGRRCAPSLPESHLETSVVPLFEDTPCKAWPLVVSPLGWAGLRWRGWGWGPGRRGGGPGP